MEKTHAYVPLLKGSVSFCALAVVFFLGMMQKHNFSVRSLALKSVLCCAYVVADPDGYTDAVLW